MTNKAIVYGKHIIHTRMRSGSAYLRRPMPQDVTISISMSINISIGAIISTRNIYKQNHDSVRIFEMSHTPGHNR